MHDDVKAYRTYEEQVDLLAGRGMAIGDRGKAIATLQRVNYYRLSGYWYPFRQQVGGKRVDDFYPGTSLDDVVALYEFDVRLRAATFSVLAPIELALRAHLGHELGRVDPCAHLDPDLLGPTVQKGNSYRKWLEGYKSELSRSREDFVAHHHEKYGGRLPVWAAVEVLDWGGSDVSLWLRSPQRPGRRRRRLRTAGTAAHELDEGAQPREEHMRTPWTAVQSSPHPVAEAAEGGRPPGP